jgi:hypothetical protein
MKDRPNNRLENPYRSRCLLFEAMPSNLILTEVSLQKRGAALGRI